MTAASNRLIDQLPARDRKRLLSACEPVNLNLGEVLNEAGSTVKHAYFPVDAFVSLVSHMHEHPGLEVGMIGREGMVGTELMLGATVAPARTLVQGAGAAWRIGAAAFHRELKASAALQRLLSLYVHVLMSQAISSAGCLRFHRVGQRLARWLLMSQDRAQQDQFRVTHEFLAYMLGVRRGGVTVAAGDMQLRGFIRYHRGALTVVDRSGLESAACSCYAADRRLYAAHLG